MIIEANYKFGPGEVVNHRRYGYRGVVLAADPECRAPDEWYQRNQTQPDRDQPWYQVLVDGGNETYVAEENLMLEPEPKPVEHPLVPLRFPTFLNGRYYTQGLN